MPRLLVIVVVMLTALRCLGAESASPAASLLSWGELLERCAADAKLAPQCEKLVAKARKLAEMPIVRRAHHLADVGKHRTWLDGRSNALEDEIRETFALAMSDFAACNTLAKELPLLAAAYRLTHEAVFRDRVITQLEEMASWSPLQRPGWTLYTPGQRLPEDGKDGNWLATGCGVRALGDTLGLLPAGTLDASLLDTIHAMLEAEVAGVVDDWEEKRPWFVRDENPVTNQWVLPTEGLVRACLILGRNGREEAYELGVRNLLKALDAHGPQGEFEEGFGYAGFTVTSLLHTAHAMAVAGDRRAVDHPFLKHFPRWLVHHFQPGKMVVNCFDAGRAYDAAKGTRPLLSLLAVCTESPTARWALAKQVGGPSDDLPGLAARALPVVGEEVTPSLFAHYERATRVNWRSSWGEDATGVWVRGGHSLDQHDHQDRGHVNLILRGRPVLIEAGTPSYHHPRMATHFATGVGHNVLQLGTAFPETKGDAGEYVWFPGWQKRRGVAPISVERLDETGGDVSVDGTACYDGLTRWFRRVTWDSGVLTVKDDVALKGGEEVVFFRWHLATEREVLIEGKDTQFRVTWDGVEMALEATSAIRVTQGLLPDHTLAGHTGADEPGNTHTCVVVQSREPVKGLALTTRVASDRTDGEEAG